MLDWYIIFYLLLQISGPLNNCDHHHHHHHLSSDTHIDGELPGIHCAPTLSRSQIAPFWQEL